jgi:dynein heavy chain
MTAKSLTMRDVAHISKQEESKAVLGTKKRSFANKKTKSRHNDSHSNIMSPALALQMSTHDLLASGAEQFPAPNRGGLMVSKSTPNLAPAIDPMSLQPMSQVEERKRVRNSRNTGGANSPTFLAVQKPRITKEKDLSGWNPAPKQQKASKVKNPPTPSQTSVIDRNSSGLAPKRTSPQQLPRTRSIRAPAQEHEPSEVEAYNNSINRYWNMVDHHSTTEERTIYTEATKQKMCDRIQLPAREFQEEENAKNGMRYPRVDFQKLDGRLMRGMISEMKALMKASDSKHHVDYQLLDKHIAEQVAIMPRHLKGGSKWWVQEFYMTHEWRVLRETGVPRSAVNYARQSMEFTNFTIESSLLELQKLWLVGTLPADWNTTIGKEEIPAEEKPVKESYCDVLLIDLLNSAFSRQCADGFSLDHFVSHIENRARTTREGLREEWIAAAAVLLSFHLKPVRHNSIQGRYKYEPLPSPEDIIQDAYGSGSPSNRGTDRDFETAQVLKHKRFVQEGLSPEKEDNFQSKNNDEASPRQVEVDRVSGVLRSASMLMSRQLREVVVNSIENFAYFFDRFKNEDLASSPFVLTIVLSDDLFTGPLVKFEPSEAEIIESLHHCIDVVVEASHNFPRVDPHIVPALPPMSEATVLGYCTLQLEDVCVEDAKQRVKEDCEKLIKNPLKLLEEFEQFRSVIDGTEEETVTRIIEGRPLSVSVEEEVRFFDMVELQDEIARLNSLIATIQDVVPDICYRPLFRVYSQGLKENLIARLKRLVAKLLNVLAKDNIEQMTSMCSSYETTTQQLSAEPLNTTELKELTQYTTASHEELDRLSMQLEREVCVRVNFLMHNEYRWPSRDDSNLFLQTFNWPDQVKSYMTKSWEMQAKRKRKLEMVVKGREDGIIRELSQCTKKIDKLYEAGSLVVHDIHNTTKRIKLVRELLAKIEEEIDDVNEQEESLMMEVSDHTTRLQELKDSLEPLDKLWSAAEEYSELSHDWRLNALPSIDAEEVEQKADGFRRTMMALVRQMNTDDLAVPKKAAETLRDELTTFIKEQVPLMILLCTPGLRDRHWEDIGTTTGLALNHHPGSNMVEMVEAGLHMYVQQIEDTCVAASKEYGLEKNMDKMVTEWDGLDFTLKPWRTTGTYILSGIDEIQTLLDDQIVKAQAMRGSRYIKPYEARITVWEKNLTDLQDILDNWLKVQGTWLYLEPIFGSDDIMRQMPTEGKLFKQVDKVWRDSMQKTFDEPMAIKVGRREGLLESLLEANKMLETINKGLNDYLETKRLFFPRFFFLSNDELLEILSETKDPLRVQPHLKKCFDGISGLDFQGNFDIHAALSPEKETLKFEYEACNTKMVNPRDTGNNVEQWLDQTEDIMKKSIAHAIDCSMLDHAQTPRTEWVTKWHSQTILTCNQIFYTQDVEKVIVNGTKEAWDTYGDKLQAELLATVETVRGNIPKLLRKVAGALIVMDVHNRDVRTMLSELNLTSTNDFDWLAQLRYYWNEGGSSAQTGKPGSIECNMINAMILYAYEYLGAQGRLVITALTDRCYRTLIGAIYLQLGGAPEGPAGTGKTETTKDLGKAIAIQCVVTNCSDGLDYLAMGKFFKGLASSGAWACFDEFNRIQLEVLSVIAQQVQCIQAAKLANAERFIFEGTEIALRMTCCPFITMNPGYAGRAELPDNLKVLFRTVAMMVPDYAVIAEILLYSNGYTEAGPLARKIVTTYKLCSEQLSSQSHYDYGMRAVMAVLRAAGNLKRSEGHLAEDILVLRSIVDVNLPKFLSPDVPLFDGIVADLFPGTIVEPPDRTNMLDALDKACENYKLQPTEYFIRKVIEVYEMMVVRHGFMIVGMPFSGKSSAWKSLAFALTLLKEKFPEDSRWSGVKEVVINPKSISMGQLYGEFDAVSHEWTDGVLAIKYRHLAQSKLGKPDDRKWLLFDGPVDAIWIENMNTVLDDNRKLCLMSGEIIAMSDVMSIMFEPMDLLVASPATVSRCGMVYMEPEQLGWQPIFDSWIKKISAKDGEVVEDMRAEGGADNDSILKVHSSYIAAIKILFKWMVEPCIAFLRKELTEMADTVDTQLVQSLINLFQNFLIECYVVKGHLAEELLNGPVDDGKKKKDKTLAVVENGFLFSLVWSVCCTSGGDGRQRFNKFFREYLADPEAVFEEFPAVKRLLDLKKWESPEFENGVYPFQIHFPNGGSIFDYTFIFNKHKWVNWLETMPDFTIPDDATYSSITVPTVCTAQFEYISVLLMSHSNKLLVIGPTGTGKSCYLDGILRKTLDQEKFNNIQVTFSAQTTANMTQNIIDGKMDKRRKGVYGPPMGKVNIVFVDDLNMPQVEEYGAQPPIELLRQLCDNGGWYDLKEREQFRTIVDTVVVAAMGPVGGGRNAITPRMMRHFNVVGFTSFDDLTLSRIFVSIVGHYFKVNSYPEDCKSMQNTIVAATLHVYKSAMSELLPTPSKSHYTFNLRDFSRVVQGIAMAKPTPGFSPNHVFRLWLHECMRVFFDRLVEDSDREWFLKLSESCAKEQFHGKISNAIEHLEGPAGEKKTVTVEDLRGLVIGNYMNPDASVKIYGEITNLDELSARMKEYLVEFNAMSRRPMDLVMFLFAVEHVSRIARILNMPGGNALLVGVGGSGRQSLTRLAAFINDCDVIQIEIAKNYGKTEWRDDLKRVLQGAGCGARQMVFLFNDTQIKNEGFVEDINNILNAGEVPNIFPSDEKIQICESVRPFAKQRFGKIAADMNPGDLYSFFINRVKDNLHVVLAFSPIGGAFRDRLRKYPSLINCCTIDWFTAWPKDALMEVAKTQLHEVEMDSDETRANVETACQHFHEVTRQLTIDFLAATRRTTYVTPTSYLMLIQTFKAQLAKCREKVSQLKFRYEAGIEKVDFASANVATMQQELIDLQPVLVESQAATAKLMEDIQEKLPGVEATKKRVGADAAAAQIEADKVAVVKAGVEQDLAEAIPALEASVKALDTLKPSDLVEVKAMKKPPATVKLVCEAVCVMLEIKSVRIKNPEDPSRMIQDYWGPSVTMISDPQLLTKLKTYDRDHIPAKVIKSINEKYKTNPSFTVESAKKASSAAAGLCMWVLAMATYDKVAKVVGPKRIALEEAEKTLALTMGELAKKQAELDEVLRGLKELEDQLEGANQKKTDLVNQVELCEKKLIRAQQLISSLGGEKVRWTQFAADLGHQYNDLTGDVLVAAGAVAYLGPFTATYRTTALEDWVAYCSNKHIPCSNPTLNAVLGEPVKIRQWRIDGLPTDSFSTDNAITVFNAGRWPLMIDPQGQANKWIRNTEGDNNLQIIKLSEGSYLRTLENAIQFGYPVLLENIQEELDPSLEPVLLKQTFRQGPAVMMKIGDSTVEYSEEFRFYITTKLRNPHYLPETSVKVTLINFMITPEGLEDQLLGITVAKERPDLQKQKDQLVLDGAQNKRTLKEIEDKILHILASVEGNILEDEGAVNTLNESKTINDDIKAKQVVVEQTEKEIDEVRLSYKPVAYSSQVLFFSIAELCNIEPTYQYSLNWFISMYLRSIRDSEPAQNTPERMANLDSYFTYLLYSNICRSLLEKDKLLFSFLLTVNILQGKGEVDAAEWYFLLTGGVAMGNPHKNVAEAWLPEKQWGEVCRLSDISAFNGLREEFEEMDAGWKKVYDSSMAHKEDIPGHWAADLSRFQKLLVLRAIRPDKVSLGVQDFVVAIMGDKFVKPPSFDLAVSYLDSSISSPLVLVLSPGSDPMSAVMKFGEIKNIQVKAISLGQGQGPIAAKMIEQAQASGSWVVLQNCHLAPSWMPSLENINEKINAENTHEDFRMWCTTYPSDVFPVSILQGGVKMTNEPPKGMRANLLGSYKKDPIADSSFFNACTKGEDFRKLLFSLCFFHALIQERRQFGPLGWNIPYEFNDSDLIISIQQLQLFLDQNEEIPFKALVYTAGECNYGGRVTDDKDRTCLMTMVKRFYQPDVMKTGFKFAPSGDFAMPEDGPYDMYVEYIESLPLVAGPEVFGMHDNATITKDQNETLSLFTNILLTQTSSGGGGGSSDRDSMIKSVAADIMSHLPDNFDMEAAMLKYPVLLEESMNTVLTMELVRFNTLTSIIRNSLVDIDKAIQGLVVMSAELEAMGTSLFFGTRPAMWMKRSYPSLKPLSGYVNDLMERLKFFNTWLQDKRPNVYWVSGFFFTQAFLTGAQQNFARRYQVAIDTVDFDFKMMPRSEYSSKPKDGVYCYGLFIDGCRWDKKTAQLEESIPKMLFSLGPIIWFKPMEKRDIENYPHYNCPVYKTSDRRGILATTGHSSNFITFIRIPSERPQAHWVERGVAMLSQLDD